MVNLLTPKQIADAAQLSEPTILRLCRANKLPGARKVGSSWRIEESQFDAWFEEGMVEESRPARDGLTAEQLKDGGRW